MHTRHDAGELMLNAPGARRRARDVGLRGLLVERRGELATLRGFLDDAEAGHGSVTLIDGPAGVGKSRLLSVAGDLARERGFHVLGAYGSELEQDFPFGLAIQLFEPLWLAADTETRHALGGGPAILAADLLAGGAPIPSTEGSAAAYPVIHGLFSLLRNALALDADEPRPVALLVDDAQWADRPSLRFLAYLAERVAPLRVVVVLAVRTAEQSTDPTALNALRTICGSVLRPQPLSPTGVASVVRSRLPGAAGSFIVACRRLTSGNPFLLIKVLDQVAHEGYPPDAATARRLDELTPESVLNAVVAALGSQPEDVGAMARALAILGDGTPVEHVAELAQVGPERAAEAADALAACELVHPGSPLSFVHPLIASAVRASISPLDRGRAHRRAAELLLEAEAPAELVAAQLTHAPAAGDPRAVDALRRAAGRSVAAGAPDIAVRMLERALAEPPPSPVLPELLAELAQAEVAAGRAGAVERLAEALALTENAGRRAELSLTLARALIEHRRYEEAAQVLTEARSDPRFGGLADEFDAAFVAVGRFVPALRERGHACGRELLARVGGVPSSGQRRALAEVAFNAALAGEQRAVVSGMVDRAWGNGTLLEDANAPSWRVLAGALAVVDDLERALELADAAAEQLTPDAADAGAVRSSRAWSLYEQGRIAEALAAAEPGLARDPQDWKRPYGLRTFAVLGLSLTQRGDLERAETALSILDHPETDDDPFHVLLLDARARLRLTQLRPADALSDALAAGEIAERFGYVSPGLVAWRTTAAQAHLALGERSQARVLARHDLEVAESIGIPRVVMRALVYAGLAERGRTRDEMLHRAVEFGDEQPARLAHIEALIALGGALRRSNRRTAARVPLQRALELCRDGGAVRLAAAARAELAASGTRSRRALLGGVESLTPSELRVARLAASGCTNREMAEALFVTRKTIEYHLRQIYRKLDISSRDQLPAALEQPLD